jgi:tetratricopeptide (TPR) repeat protein
MGKVSLRLYNREIENLIDHGQMDEAISHSKYILQSYPKHIDTYRLLGKALLEGRHYGAAADVFQRVLSSIPDDFVSHVGMSIIREDEGNLDEAVWHMERAYEVQPANVAIQEELRRLLGRRDGVEPSKLRLTRGALARMYAKGDLYQQAIAEIRALLAIEPGRADLQVLLADMCLKAGKQVESTELCSTLLSKYPYCLEANSILAKILPNTSRAADAQVYNQRIFALEPYAAFQNEEYPSLHDVPDNAIMIERQEYFPGVTEGGGQPEWAVSLGINLADTTRGKPDESFPDWLADTEKSEYPMETKKLSLPDKNRTASLPSEKGSDDLIPDWMTSAGWATSSGSAEGEQEIYPIPVEEPISEASPADLPDWLKEMAPPTPTPEIPAESTNSIPDWVGNLEEEKPIVEESTFSTGREIPDWIRDIQEEPISADTDFEGAEAGEVIGPADNQAVPDWLQELKTQAPSTSAQEAEPVSESQPVSPVELPEWLKDVEYIPEEARESSEIPVHKPEPQATSVLSPAIDESEANLPEWLRNLGKVQTTTQLLSEDLSTPSPVLTSILEPEQIDETPTMVPDMKDQDATFAWLENLASKQGVDEDTLFMKPEERLSTPPDWIQKIVSDEIEETTPSEQKTSQDEPTPVAEEVAKTEDVSEEGLFESIPMPGATVDLSYEEEQPSSFYTEENAPVSGIESPETFEEGIPEPEQLTPSEEDTESALAWLESLAAKHGAEEESLYIKPEDRTENPPEWIQQISKGAEEEGITEENIIGVGGAHPEKEEEELPGWLKGYEEAQYSRSEEAVEEIASSWYPESLEIPEKPVEEPTAESVPIVPDQSVTVEPVISDSLGKAAAETQPVENYQSLLEQSQTAISDGKVTMAIEGYDHLVKNGAYLDEIIHDLRDALYHFPVDIAIWQTLGDAYLRSNRIQDALDAFAKAEDLIR